MEQVKVDSLMAMFGAKIPTERVPEIIERLKNAPDEKYTMLLSVPLKDPTIITVISVVLGSMGIDRFMLGDIGLGVLKLLTLGVCGIMWLVDLFLVGKRAAQVNYRQISMLL